MERRCSWCTQTRDIEMKQDPNYVDAWFCAVEGSYPEEGEEVYVHCWGAHRAEVYQEKGWEGPGYPWIEPDV
jgi:hypothetical protein